MANSKSAQKRARQTAGRTLRNRSVRSRLRRMQKQLGAADAKREPADLRAMVSEIDRAAKRGVIHRNAARRRKARLLRTATAPAAAE